MKIKFVLVFLIVLLFSCEKPEVRKPVTHLSSVSFFEKSIQLNKEILQEEEKIFKNIIKKDSLNTYKTSPYGFWYYYNRQNKTKSVKVVSGNEVIISYEIKDIDGNTILSKEELGSKSQKNKGDRIVKIDGEDFILGLHEGIKLMQIGDIITFLMPSNKAFGATGLQNRIAPNQPLIIKVELKKIVNNNNKIKLK